MSYDLACKDIICALSSAQGRAALAIVRASGANSLSILQRIFKPKHSSEIKPFVAMHGHIVSQDDNVIDDVMITYFKQGRSFTGEESFEIYCHGNGIIVQEILDVICKNGARLAEPGEFSLRAMLNGAIDLAQAESIADLIHAESVQAKNVALKGVEGGLRAHCRPVRESIVRILAEIEARMDFPDEELGSFDRQGLLLDLTQAIDMLDGLLKHANYALKLNEGMRVVIVGEPNAGKSTLLNRLSREERAIVHETAGTTRDVIEGRIIIGGVPVTLVDVAGIRASDEASAIEKIGIEKALNEIKRADLIIWLADCTKEDPFKSELIALELLKKEIPVIKVLNKSELSLNNHCDSTLMISAMHGHGISDLEGILHKKLISDEHHSGEMFITRSRQRDELMLAKKHLSEAHEALKAHLVDEVVTSELRSSGLAFDRLFGTMLSEDVLDVIFTQFCIGK